MKWVTRERPKTDRIACPWLIRNVIDPEAEFLYVPADQVLAVAEREGAHSYDAPGAEYTHRDGLCSFEVLVEAYGPHPSRWRSRRSGQSGQPDGVSSPSLDASGSMLSSIRNCSSSEGSYSFIRPTTVAFALSGSDQSAFETASTKSSM